VKKTFAAVLAGVALMAVAGAAEAKEWTKVRIATEGAYPPWNNMTSAGQLEGFELDLAKDLCARMKVECEIVAQEWDGMIPGLQSGKYDVIMAGMSVTDERKQAIDFAGPYALDPSVFSALSDSDLQKAEVPTGLVDLGKAGDQEKQAIEAMAEALDGMTVGVQVSTIQQNLLQEHMPGITVQTYDKVDSMALDLTSGRIDAMLADKSATQSVIEAQGGNVKMFGPDFMRGVLGIGVGAGVRKDDTDLKALFDKAIAEANADGTVGKLSTQWFGVDISIKN
jgi:octopine/nopaline transport system substrate-binding protein